MCKRGTYFVCVCVCVCVESTAQKQSLYDKLSIAVDFSLRFRDFQITKLFSYRPFCSFFEVAAIFLHDELLCALYAYAHSDLHI